MIISWVSGGLGNQMFQYALGKVLAKKNSDQLYLDLTSYNPFISSTDTPRSFELDIFKLSYLEASRSEIVRLSDSNPLINFVNSMFKIKVPTYPNGYIAETSHAYQSNILQMKGNIYLKGFWQTEKYFKDDESLIRKEFQFKHAAKGKNKVILEGIRNSNSVSVHIRRGDYVKVKATNNFHGTCNVNYYAKAIKYIYKNVSQPTFYIFSDDPAWCKKNLRFQSKAIFVDHNTGDSSWEDMRLMSNCKHNIIANSSFSWWAAWLNANPDKIIISPKSWFRDKTVDTRDVVPSTWIKL